MGRDTIVSGSFEYWPPTFADQIESDDSTYTNSLNAEDPTLRNLAISEEDVSFVYYDTLVDDQFTPADEVLNREHKPLGLRIRQSSYAWSYPHTRDFVIFRYQISNVGLQQLNKVYFGINFGGEINGPRGSYPPYDDQCGFVDLSEVSVPGAASCRFGQRIDLAWIADNDGNPDNLNHVFDTASALGVVGVKILSPSTTSNIVSFNWWVTDTIPSRDFGPRRRGTTTAEFRDFGRGLGTPRGDRNLYYVMSSGEIDYDQMYTATNNSSGGWLPPPVFGEELARGSSPTVMLSVGPLDLAPGQTTEFVYALIGSNDFHADPLNYVSQFNPVDQRAYRNNLSFTGLINNAVQASWVYDNPGFDTNGDGYKGQFIVCIDSTLVNQEPDTVWITGDGIADFRAAAPPPTPSVRVSSKTGTITIEWNGLATETTPDIFTHDVDFEGYRVYLGLSNQVADLQLVSSYDKEDYVKWYFDPSAGNPFDPGEWVPTGTPLLKKQLQAEYANGDNDWNPLLHSIDNPLRIGDSLIHFKTQDWNQSDLSDTMQIHKIYPDAPYPHTLILDSAFTEDTLWIDPVSDDTVFYAGGELTPDGERFKYFEYRYVFDNLLPSQVYYVAVTTFDYGSPLSGLPFLETDPSENTIRALAQDRVSENQELDVVVYPNPYRIDGNYRDRGFEGRGSDLPDERTRLVHFTNLPPQCDIKIFTLDGDLVRQIIHDKSPGAADAMHDTWDVLSRNLQVPVSGIYYWVVETPDGRTQLGKLVLIM